MSRADGPSDALALRAAVADALTGRGPAVAPAPLAFTGPLPAGTALVLQTSGSTGLPREVALSADALVASARATHERLGGDGQWLLALPPTHVAGLQVVLRSVVAGTPLVTADLDSPFSPAGFAADAARMDGERRYVSLVPTQLHRLVHAQGTADGEAALAALRSFDAILLGGAAAPPALLAGARAAGARVVTTYGMTETCGGCVYDGVPLAGVRVRVVERSSGQVLPPGEAGVVEISGPVLATGYLGDEALTAEAFRRDQDGVRRLRTNDLGSLSPGGSLTVHGRADDVVVSGGVNVAPAAVEAVLAGALAGDGIGEVCVVGVPDPEWGQAVVAVVTRVGSDRATSGPSGEPDAELLTRARHAVATTLGPPAAPRYLLVVDDLPRRGPGKIDRAAVTALAARTAPRTTH